METLNVLDYILIIAIIIGAFIGLSRGFLASLLSLAGKILAAYLSVKVLQPFIEYFKIKDLFLRGLLDIVINHIPLGEEIKSLSLSSEGLSLIGTSFENNKLMNIMGDTLSKEWEHLYSLGEKLGLSTVGEMVALITANFIINVVSFLVLFFLFLIGFSLLKSLLVKILSMSGFVSGIDKVLGFILGAAVDIFIIAIIIGFSFDLLNLFSLEEQGLFSQYKKMLDESFLQGYFYNIYSLIIREGTKLL